jgi:hypothetical protein
MSTTSSRNFTTLYSGSGSVVPQGAYGNANVVSLLSVGTDGGNTVSNIVATGNITTTAQMSAQGNITTAGFFVGSLVGNVSGNVTAAGSNTQVQFNNNGLLGADGDFTYNNSTNALAVTGNITGGNVAGTTVTATTVLATTINATTASATGNVTGGNILTPGTITSTGNITGGNILTPGTITAAGNITAPNFIGNISGNIDAGGSNTQVQFNDGDLLAGSAGFTFDKTTNAAVVAGNVTAGNVSTGGVVSATGNVSGGNIRTTGTVSATGNIITDGYFLGNVANASGIFVNKIFNGNSEANIGTSGGNANISIGGTSNVAVFSPTGVSVAGTISATGNIITDGYFLGNVANASGIFASRIFNGNSEANIGTSGGNANISIGGTSNVVVVSTTGVSVTGNVSAGNVITGVITNPIANANVEITAGGPGIQTGNIVLTAYQVFVGSDENFPKRGDIVGIESGDLYLQAGGSVPPSSYTQPGMGFKHSNGFTGGNVEIYPVPGNNLNLLFADLNMQGGPTSASEGNLKLGGNIIKSNLGNLQVITYGPKLTLGANVAANGTPFTTPWGGEVQISAQVLSLGPGNTNPVSQYGATIITQAAGTQNAAIQIYPQQTVSGFYTNQPQMLLRATPLLNPQNGGGNIELIPGGDLGGGSKVKILNGDLILSSNIGGFVGNIEAAGNIRATGNMIAGGNITANTGSYFLGDGGLLSNITATSATQIVNGTSNVRIVTANSNITMSVNGTSDVVVVTGTGANIAGYAEVTGNIVGGNVAAVANVSGGNILTSGQISAAGNITSGSGSYFIGDGSLLTGITTSYGNANVSNFLANGFGSNTITTTGNITSGNSTVTTTLYVSNIEGAAGQTVTITAEGTGDIHLDADSIRIGDNNQPATLTTHGTGNLILRTHEGSAVEGNITVVNGVNGNIQLNPNGTGVVTTTSISASGNITGANLVATANLTSTQQTVIGTANVGTTGNIVVSGRNIATDMKWSPDGATGTAAYTGRVLMGTGWLGNNAVGISSRLTSMDTIDRSNSGSTIRQFESETILNLTANVTNNATRQQAIGGRIRVGGGAAANTVALTSAFGAPFSLSSGQFNLDIGNVTPYFLGNTSIGHATMNGGVITLNGGSSIGNAYAFVGSVVGGGSGASNITNYIGYTSSFSSGPNVTSNLFCFYNGNASTLGTHGVLTGNTARAATNYYFLRNDDDVAQVKLGSLRNYHEFQFSTATTGTVNIDKNNAQIQLIAPTANVTIGDFQNFVTTASNSVSSINQTDTVTLIIKQGATPYTVTMPTGNAAIKYASGNSTVGATANAVTMISVSGANVGGAALYMVTVSPEFV